MNNHIYVSAELIDTCDHPDISTLLRRLQAGEMLRKHTQASVDELEMIPDIETMPRMITRLKSEQQELRRIQSNMRRDMGLLNTLFPWQDENIL